MRRRAIWIALAGAALMACPSDDEPPDRDTADSDAADATAETDAPPATDAADAAPDVEETFTPPAYVPAPGTAADERLSFDRLSAPVRVIHDDRGVPHIYGDAPADMAFVQGFVTARDRIFQMHTLRSAAQGRLASFSGAGSLSGDLFLRLLRLGAVGAEMAAWTEANDPETHTYLAAYADGVNAYLARLRAGDETPPVEVVVFGDDIIDPWTPADTMAIVRLQTWDLGFDLSDLDRLETILDIRERFAETPLEGVEGDVFLPEPIRKVATAEPEGGASTTGAFDLGAVLDDAFYRGVRAADVRRTTRPLRALDQIPHHAFRGDDFGSNSWALSGELTASGAPLLANDTHLALRNPAIFYHVHMSNAAAGGDLDISGVQFAGAPGIVLGHNAHAAWAATVLGTDVTDVYIETLDEAGERVRYDGDWVALDARDEVFTYLRPSSADTCIDAAPAWVPALPHTVEADGGRCTLTVTFHDVPHRGPIIPWSYGDDAEGEPTAASVAWTGLSPTREFGAVRRLWTAHDVDTLQDALDRFDVGAQSWLAATTDGDILWYPSHQLPVRAHIADGDTRFPPFLPMPGDTSATRWDGFVARDALPQIVNPPSGWLATANQDPTGTSFDNDPFNEDLYLGYQWTPGFRKGRIGDRIAEIVRGGEGATVADMQAIQADHKSNFGEVLVPPLLAAIEVAREGADPRAAALFSDEIDEASTRLRGWSDLGWRAASGVRMDDDSDDARASIATSIFNAYLVALGANALGDEGLRDGVRLERVLWRMTYAPATMTATYDAELGDTRLWDDVDTEDVVESRHEIMVKSLAQALAFLADAERVGPAVAGGFGDSDMDTWRWGRLHTVTLRHNVAAGFDIPPPDEHPHGFPRPCDNFCVDASHPGMHDTSFTFSSGPAIRNVYALTDPPSQHAVVPGGQSEQPESPHYRDGMDLWIDNLAPVVPWSTEAVVGAKTRIIDFTP